MLSTDCASRLHQAISPISERYVLYGPQVRTQAYFVFSVSAILKNITGRPRIEEKREEIGCAAGTLIPFKVERRSQRWAYEAKQSSPSDPVPFPCWRGRQFARIGGDCDTSEAPFTVGNLGDISSVRGQG